MATKGDLAGVATNVSFRLLGEQIKQATAETRALRADMRLLTGIVTGMATSVQALVDHQMQLADRVRALEEPEAP